MASDRINCGIDLGTSNSAIVRMERGEPVVVKSGFQGDATPSAVSFSEKGRISVGIQAYNKLGKDRLLALRSDRDVSNVFIQFKRTMGTDHRYTPSVRPDEKWTSEALSAEVLKELRKSVTDDEVYAAVVTIPAAFTVPQQQATMRAAELAGLRQCELLQEPVAAAMAYGLAEPGRVNQKWLVFDFGGGTFDAALVLVEDGHITVKDTEGDNHLGGKDLDLAVVEKIILPEIASDLPSRSYLDKGSQRGQRLREALRRWAEEANIKLSSRATHTIESDLGDIELATGHELDLDIEVSRDLLRRVVSPIFQRAIDKVKALLQRHGMKGRHLDELILVGGPTYSPILRQMLTNQICRPNTSMDPMTVVAKGAAIYASTVKLDESVLAERGPSEALALDIGFKAVSTSFDEFVTIHCLDLEKLWDLGPLSVELVRTGWRSGKEALTERGTLIEVLLEENCANTFDFEITTVTGDRLQSSPSEVTIVQGIGVSGSPLPNSIGVEVLDSSRDRRVFEPLKGAEKSKPLPVTGRRIGLTTQTKIRPGISSDRLLIRIYEGGDDAPGTPVFLSDHIFSLELTGDQVNRVIPKGAKFDLTVTSKASNSIPESVSVLFPDLDDEEFDLPIPIGQESTQVDWMDDEINEAKKHIDTLRKSKAVKEHVLSGLGTRFKNSRHGVYSAGSDTDARNQAISRLREALRELYTLLDDNDWSITEAELMKAWNELCRANQEEGHSSSRPEMLDFKRRMNQVRTRKDPEQARDLITQIRRMEFGLKRCEISKGLIAWAKMNFGEISWTNREQARRRVQEGVQALVQEADCDDLFRHAGLILQLVDQDSDAGPRPPVPVL